MYFHSNIRRDRVKAQVYTSLEKIQLQEFQSVNKNIIYIR